MLRFSGLLGQRQAQKGASSATSHVLKPEEDTAGVVGRRLNATATFLITLEAKTLDVRGRMRGRVGGTALRPLRPNTRCGRLQLQQTLRSMQAPPRQEDTDMPLPGVARRALRLPLVPGPPACRASRPNLAGAWWW